MYTKQTVEKKTTKWNQTKNLEYSANAKAESNLLRKTIEKKNQLCKI